MKHPREIVIAPVFTEKTSMMKEQVNAYTFQVSVNANKIEIKKAIEKIFEVDVVSVNTINYSGKPKRQGRYTGFRSDWKKAIVVVKAGQSITDFEI